MKRTIYGIKYHYNYSLKPSPKEYILFCTGTKKLLKAVGPLVIYETKDGGKSGSSCGFSAKLNSSSTRNFV